MSRVESALNLMVDILSVYYKCIPSAETHEYRAFGPISVSTLFRSVLISATRAQSLPHISVTSCIYAAPYTTNKQKQTNSVAFCPQTNYTD
jgi:hypothetical protein